MRVISLILALFLFGTIFIPCTDSDEVQDLKTELIADTTQDSDIHFDFCSPLCSCHCCHSHVITSIVAFDFHDNQPEEVLPFYQDTVAKYSFPFWQPPRVS